MAKINTFCSLFTQILILILRGSDESDDEFRVIKSVYGIGALITRVTVIMIVVNIDGENKEEMVAESDAQIMLKMML